MKLTPLYRVRFQYPQGWGIALAGPDSPESQDFYFSEHPDYRWLNDSLAVGVGEVRAPGNQPVELVIDWSELIWEPVPE